MSGNRIRWPRFMRRKFGPEGGAWYCCGGKLMRSMEAPAEPGVRLYLCPHCGRGLRAQGQEVLEVLRPQPEPLLLTATHDALGQMHLEL